MLNVVILWIFSCGIELGVVVLCLLPLRFILRRKVPRLFSYLLWCAVPVTVVFSLCTKQFPNLSKRIADFLDETDPVVVPDNMFFAMKTFWTIGSIIVLVGMLVYFLVFRMYLVGSIRLRDNIYLCSRIDTAVSDGLFQPKIYLSTGIPKEYREFVIQHEQVHIKRKDIWMKYLAIGLLALFWFQPIMWLACYLYINDMEEACDETVLRTKEKEFRVTYAKVLYDLTFEVKKVRGFVLGFGNGAIKERIRRAALYEKESKKVRVVAFVICILFVVATVLISRQVPPMIQAEKRKEEMINNALSVKEKGVEAMPTIGK